MNICEGPETEDDLCTDCKALRGTFVIWGNTK